MLFFLSPASNQAFHGNASPSRRRALDPGVRRSRGSQIGVEGKLNFHHSQLGVDWLYIWCLLATTHPAYVFYWLLCLYLFLEESKPMPPLKYLKRKKIIK